MRYTFDDDDDGADEDELAPRRSTRNSDRSTPAEGPTVTASGRTVRPRGGGMYGETLLSGQASDGNTPMTNDYVDSEDVEHAHGTRASGRFGGMNGSRKRKYLDGDNDTEQMSEEEDAASSTGWNSADNEGNEDADEEMDEDDEDLGDELDDDLGQGSLVVKLKVPRLGGLKAGDSVKTESGHDTTSVEVATSAASQADRLPSTQMKEEVDTINVKTALPGPNGHPTIEPDGPDALKGFVAPSNTDVNKPAAPAPAPAANLTGHDNLPEPASHGLDGAVAEQSLPNGTSDVSTQ